MIRNKKIYYINSRNRLDGDDSDFSYLIELDPNKKYDSVVVLSCIIPKSYYLVQSGNNTFILSENSVNTVITVSPGNYSRRTFQAYLITLLNNNSSQGWTYNITYPTSGADTGKYTYSVSGNSSNQPSFTFPTTSTLYEQMGFNLNSTNTFTSDTLESVNILKFQLENNLHIVSDIVNSSIGNNYLLNIPATFPDYSDIYFETHNIETQSRPLSTQNNNIYRFTLINEDGIKINLNGLNMTMVLMVYEQDNIFDILKQYIKIRLMQ